MLDYVLSGVGKFTNAAGDVAQSGSSAITRAVDNTPDLVVWGIIPCVVFYIVLILLIHFGFDFSLFDNCKINEKKEEKCYNAGTYYSIYLLVPLVISIIISVLFYKIVFYIKNPNMIGLNIVSGIMS